jgi:hypothetical protein
MDAPTGWAALVAGLAVQTLAFAAFLGMNYFKLRNVDQELRTLRPMVHRHDSLLTAIMLHLGIPLQ